MGLRLGERLFERLDPRLKLAVAADRDEQVQEIAETAGELGLYVAALDLAVQRDGFTANRRDGLQRPG
jgi:hypothetical protein